MNQPDPNEKLIGKEFDSDHGRLRVVGTPEWSNGTYVECVGIDEPEFKTARAVSLMRHLK